MTPSRFCDIVMKGGITSGIVYPAAVFEIAQDFLFKNVGGTSAGAIAASLTAAAERRRARDGSMDGFNRVADIPNYLSTDSRLYHLFTPNASTRSLYHTVVSLFGRPRFQPAWAAKWCGLVWAYPIASIVGGLIGALVLAATLVGHAGGAWFVAGLVGAAVTLIAGMTIAIVIALVRDLLTRLPKNSFGMVTGVDDADRTSLAALCTWLTRELELTAGLEPGKAPLTFGMLWDAKRDVGAEALPKIPDDPDVNLEMVTTNVTWGRPYKFPTDVMFYYDPEELRKFFPDHVIEWMKQRPRKARADHLDEAAHFEAAAKQGKLPLPLAADLPVIVATRMSLAFPVLLSAVPLYEADFSTPPPAGGVRVLEPLWFSDGGISSNFPVTLFDGPLARWPTFAINLAPFQPAYPRKPDEAKNVYMPRTNAAGTLPAFARFKDMQGFFGAVADAMQNWNDNTQIHLPGYRDRIVTVFLDKDEGGLNLDMPHAILTRLRDRGAAAGKLIAGRFKEPSTLPPGPGAMNWENQRWLRFRSTMGALRAYLPLFRRALDQPESPDVPYEALILATDGTPVHRYPIDPSKRADVDALAKDIATIGTRIDALETLGDELPHPLPQLVLRPSLDS